MRVRVYAVCVVLCVCVSWERGVTSRGSGKPVDIDIRVCVCMLCVL